MVHWFASQFYIKCLILFFNGKKNFVIKSVITRTYYRVGLPWLSYYRKPSRASAARKKQFNYSQMVH